jgi:hypothetical protein
MFLYKGPYEHLKKIGRRYEFAWLKTWISANDLH